MAPVDAATALSRLEILLPLTDGADGGMDFSRVGFRVGSPITQCFDNATLGEGSDMGPFVNAKQSDENLLLFGADASLDRISFGKPTFDTSFWVTAALKLFPTGPLWMVSYRSWLTLEHVFFAMKLATKFCFWT